MKQPDRIARLVISLDGIEPVIWRQVEVPITGFFGFLRALTLLLNGSLAGLWRN